MHMALLRELEMEDKDTLDLRQQVVESTKLLLKAFDKLECKSKGRSSSSALAVPSMPTSSTSSSSTSASQTQSASKLEMKKLFNWSSGSNPEVEGVFVFRKAMWENVLLFCLHHHACA